MGELGHQFSFHLWSKQALHSLTQPALYQAGAETNGAIQPINKLTEKALYHTQVNLVNSGNCTGNLHGYSVGAFQRGITTAGDQYLPI